MSKESVRVLTKTLFRRAVGLGGTRGQVITNFRVQRSLIWVVGGCLRYPASLLARWYQQPVPKSQLPARSLPWSYPTMVRCDLLYSAPLPNRKSG